MHLQRLRETNDSDRLGGKPIDSEALFGSLRQARFADGWRNIPITLIDRGSECKRLFSTIK
jgi:hypothetical protein